MNLVVNEIRVANSNLPYHTQLSCTMIVQLKWIRANNSNFNWLPHKVGYSHIGRMLIEKCNLQMQFGCACACELISARLDVGG